MTKSLSNIVKSYCVVQKEAKSYVIDSNELVSEKVKLYEQMIHEEEDGFQEGLSAHEIMGTEDDMANALLGDSAEAGIQAAKALEDSQAEIEAMYAEANAEIQRNREQAMSEIEVLKNQTLEDAKKSGQQTGYQEGFQKAEGEYAKKQNELQKLEHDLIHKYEQKIKELEPRLVKKITGIYEKVFKVNLSQFEGMVAGLILEIVQNNDGNKSYFIHLSKEDFEGVVSKKDEMMAKLSASCELEFVIDHTLAQGDCFIETSSGIYDCGVDTQLQELNRLLQVVSYQ